MHTKNIKTRITIDLPADIHKKLKTAAAIFEKTMRDIIIESLNLHPHFEAQNKTKHTNIS